MKLWKLIPLFLCFASPVLGFVVIDDTHNQTVGGNKTFTGTTTFSHTTISDGSIGGEVDVKFYGATGDGSTNDTTAIQNALNASTHIYIPEGTFIISTSALTPQAGTTIRCAGPHKTVLQAKSGETTLNLISINNKANITIDGCGFQAGGYTWSTDSLNATPGVGNGIDIIDGDNITIRNSYFTKFKHGISTRGSSTAGRVNRKIAVVDSEFLSDTPTFSAINAIGVDGLIVSRNKVWETITHGTDNTLEGNNGVYIYYTPDGVVGAPESTCRGVEVTDTEFYGYDANSLETINWFCPGTLVKNNRVIGYDNTNAASTDSNDHASIACQMTGPTGGTNPGCSDSVIEGNYVEKGQIRLNASAGTLSGVALRNNTVKQAGCAAIRINGSTSQTMTTIAVTDNTIDTVDDFAATPQACGAGILVSSNGSVVNLALDDNTILNTDKDGIWFRSQVTGARAKGNLIVNPGVRAGYGSGIVVDGSTVGAQATVLVSENVITNVLSGVVGIQATGTVTALSVLDNLVNAVAGANGYSLGASTTYQFAGNQCTGAGTCATLSGTALAASYEKITTASPITSTLATGTAPFTVASTTQVSNLNCSQLIGGTWAVPGTIGSTTPNSCACSSVTDSGLTAGRIPFASTGGLLADSANFTYNSSTGVTVLDTVIQQSGTVASSGGIRLRKNQSMNERNTANTGDVSIFSVGAHADDEVILGDAVTASSVQGSLGTPVTPSNGQWWVECSGTSPTRNCSIKVQDTSGTRTIATSANF